MVIGTLGTFQRVFLCASVSFKWNTLHTAEKIIRLPAIYDPQRLYSYAAAALTEAVPPASRIAWMENCCACWHNPHLLLPVTTVKNNTRLSICSGHTGNYELTFMFVQLARRICASCEAGVNELVLPNGDVIIVETARFSLLGVLLNEKARPTCISKEKR